MSRCTGHCCELFYLPFTSKQIKKIRKLKTDGFEYIDMKTLTPNNEFGIPKKELMTIANMVEHTPITKRKYFGVFKKLLPKYDTHQDDLIIKKSLEQYYTCKNFDKKNKICKIYEDRPRMCKGFPHENDFKLTYGSKCNYKKCTGCNNKEGDNKSYMNIKK